jgi:UDP-N-acetylglucosamine 2-epimerase
MAKAKPIVVSVVGARPQFIKLAALLRKLDRAFDSRVVHTGQHFDREMSDTFFAEYQLRLPDVNLHVGRGAPGTQLGKMVERLDAYLGKTKPSAVLVFGDTTSTMAGALAAAARNIPVGHVEAGLRSFDKRMAEEKNRVVADHLSRWLFCPTQEAARNLKAEGITKGVCPVGDLMTETFRLPRRRPPGFPADKPAPAEGEYYYITLHRAEAVDDPENLARLLGMLEILDKPIVLPLHPRTRKNLRRFKLLARLSRMPDIRVLPPVNHQTSLWLIANAHAVLTDSGGVQKEAYWAGVRCLTVRTVTEWNLLVDAGYNTLVGFDGRRLKRAMVQPFKPRKVVDNIFAKKAVSNDIVRQLKTDLA